MRQKLSLKKYISKISILRRVKIRNKVKVIAKNTARKKERRKGKIRLRLEWLSGGQIWGYSG